MPEITITTPDTEGLAEYNHPFIEGAEALVIEDVSGHERALLILKDLREARVKVVKLFKGPKEATFRAHRETTGAEKTLLGPIDSAAGILNGKLTRYEAAQALIERKRVAAEQAEAQRLEEDRALAEAAHAESVGDKELAEHIISQPVEAPVVIQQRPAGVAKVEGVVNRTTWGGVVTDLVALVKHIAEHPEHINLIKPNPTAINSLARSLHENLGVPGIRAVATTGRAVSTS